MELVGFKRAFFLQVFNRHFESPQSVHKSVFVNLCKKLEIVRLTVCKKVEQVLVGFGPFENPLQVTQLSFKGCYMFSNLIFTRNRHETFLMNKELRVKLHNNMVKHCEEMTQMLERTQPGDLPTDKDASILCKQMENTAHFMAIAFDADNQHNI